MMTNKLRVILPATAALTLVVAIVIALWMVGSASGEREKFSSLEFAPRDAEVFLAVNTDPTSLQWLAVAGALDDLNAKDPVRREIDEALAEFDMEWDRDITPVAGDEAFFSMPDIDDSDTWTAGILIRDSKKAKETFDALNEDEVTLEEEEYEGVTVYIERSSFGSFGSDVEIPGTAIAFMDELIVLGSSSDEAKAVIDVVQGRAESAGENERLKEFRSYQEGDFLVWGYADLASVWDSLADGYGDLGSFTDTAGVDPDEVVDEIGGLYDRVGFSVSSMNDGFAFDFIALHAPDYEPDDSFVPAEAYDPRLAEMLPASTMFYASVFDVYGQMWEPIKAELGDTALADDMTLDDFLEEIESEIGIDIEADFLALLTGELALAGDLSDFDSDVPDFEIFMLADVESGDTAEDTLVRLGDYLAGEDIILAPRDSGDVTIWELEGERIAWGVRDDRLIVGYPDDAVESAIGIDGGSLADSEDWKRTLELLPVDTVVVGYLSLVRILEEVQRIDGVEEDFRKATDGDLELADLEPVRSLGFGARDLDGGTHFRVLIYMNGP